MDPITQDFKGVQLASTGTFNASTGKVTFTRQDFDDMADACKTLEGKVDFPIKLGHNEGQELLQEDGLPAAGWIEHVRREGNHLIADFMRVPEKIAAIIKGGGLRKRSIEAMRNVELAGQRFKFVLTGLALLGEDLPAVDSLDDIAALYTAAKLELPDAKDEDATTLIFIAAAESPGGNDDDDDEIDEVIKEIQRVMGRADGLIKGRKGAPQLRGMLGGAIAELRRVSKAKLGDNDMEITKEILEKLGLEEGATDDQITAAIAGLKDKVDAGDKGGANDGANDDDKKGEGDSEALKAEIEKREALEAKVLTLENDKATSAATEAADGAIKASKFAPAVRADLIKMALGNPESFATLVKNTPVIAGMTTGVIGSAEGNDADADLSEYEPSADQIVFLKQTGVSREEYILQGIKDAEEVSQKELVSASVKASLAPKKAD